MRLYIHATTFVARQLISRLPEGKRMRINSGEGVHEQEEEKAESR